MVVDEESLKPLKPIYKLQRPPWVGFFSDTDYKGRPNWWAELGYTNMTTPRLQHRVQLYGIREDDPEWWDPPVADGTSMAGFKGMDTRYYGNTDFKGDTPGNLFDYKDMLMKSSAQYKQIAEKYNLSPEHPGIDVSPSMNRLEYTPWRNLGVGGFFSQSGAQWGPRFFDKPLNEDCLGKGLALAKYALFFSAIDAFADYRIAYSKELKGFKYGEYAGHFLRKFPFPTALGFGYGVCICTSATIRNRDDIYNPLYAAAFTGILTTTIKDNVALGVTVTLSLMLIGTVWHYARVSRAGFTGPQYNPMSASPFWTGPHFYKMIDFGQTEIPKETF